MKGDPISRRRALSVPLAGLFAWVAGRGLGGCGGPDVSVRIRRVDGTAQGGRVVVRASVVLTNHTNQAQMLPVRVALSDASGASLGAINDTANVAAAELICHCYEVTVPRAFVPDGSTLTISYGEESATASLQSYGTTALPSCSYTCNY